MMGRNMDGHLGYKCAVANAHPPSTRARHETCTAPLNTCIDAEYKRASPTPMDSIGSMCIALYSLSMPRFPFCSHRDSNANVRATTRRTLAYDHSPSAPRHGAYGSVSWIDQVPPFMALRGSQSVGTHPAECCRYHQVCFRPQKIRAAPDCKSDDMVV